MISATGIVCPPRTNPTIDGPDLHGTQKSDQKTCPSTPSPVKLSHAEITAIAKTHKYLNGINGEKDFRRLGIESQCNGIAIVKNTRTTVLPRLNCYDDVSIWKYSSIDKVEAFYDELPQEILLKGQILARTEQTAAGIPLIALTAELEVHSNSKLDRIYCPELITAPLTKEEFAQAFIQPSLDHFRTLFINQLTKAKMYSLSEVIATYNSTKPPNALTLIIEDQVPLKSRCNYPPVGRPADYSFYATPQASSCWWTQSNIAMPFKNIKNLPQIMDARNPRAIIIKFIRTDDDFKSYFINPLQKNPLTDAWLWHFLYLAVGFGYDLGPLDANNSTLMVPKFYNLNLRYSHHQLIMEILDEEGIDILLKAILNQKFTKGLFAYTIRDAIHFFHRLTYKLPARNLVFDRWLLSYLDDLTNLCKIRKKYGTSTVYNANTNRPFILVDDRSHNLPFKLLSALPYSPDDYYRSVLPTYTNDSGEPCTVLERRQFSKKSMSVTHGTHYPFTAKSKWYSEPTETEQKQLNLYWA